MKKITSLLAVLSFTFMFGCDQPLTDEEKTSLTLTSMSTDETIPGLRGSSCTEGTCDDDTLSYVDQFAETGIDPAVVDTPYFQLEAMQPINELYTELTTVQGLPIECAMDTTRATEFIYTIELCHFEPGDYLLNVSVEFESNDTVGYAFPITIEEDAIVYCNNGELGPEPSETIGYCVKSNALDSYMADIPYRYSFSIVNQAGETVKTFDTVHEKIMHVIVVRKDLAEFQHVHPDYDEATGMFTLPTLTFPSDGEYRIFADFKPTAATSQDQEILSVTIHDDVSVGEGDFEEEALGNETRSNTAEDYAITLHVSEDPVTASQETQLSFEVTRDGKPVNDLEDYLGAKGHVVILREETLNFLHIHPVLEREESLPGVNFMTTFPTSGKYKVFMQFQHEGVVHTTSFVAEVADSTPSSGEAADHSMDMNH